jgi:hypothetical protein
MSFRIARRDALPLEAVRRHASPFTELEKSLQTVNRRAKKQNGAVLFAT